MYFLFIAILIIFIVWVANIYILNNNYEYMKAKQMRSFANIITTRYRNHNDFDDEFVKSIQTMAIKNDIDIIIERENGQAYFISQNGDISVFDSSLHQLIYLYSNERAEIRQYLESNDAFVGYSTRQLGESSDYKLLAFGTYLDGSKDEGSILYLFSTLFPVASTVSILKRQLIIVTLISLLITLIVSAILSRKIIRPLSDIRKAATRLSNGEYGIDFKGEHYSEIIDLGNTLTYTSHELEKSEKLQKDLIANISHDLRTPLTMVKSYAEMIRDLSGDNPEKRNKHLAVIIDETDRLNQLVDDMFTLSKMQSGIIKLEKKDFDLAKCISEIFKTYEILVENDGYDISLSIPEHVIVNGDELKIGQVISNLINNAVKYCGDDKYIRISLKEKDGYALFSVSDHGAGIPEDQLDNVWERYYRVSSNYHRSTKGTGLGLSIVKEILLLHDSKYGVESKLGEGSTFWFTLKITDNM